MVDYEVEQGKSQEEKKKEGEDLSSTMAPQAADKGNGASNSIYSASALKIALEAKDAEQISAQLNGISLDEAKEIAGNSTLMGLIESQAEEVRNSVYDKIYIGIQDVDTLCKIAYKRLGVAFGTKYSTDDEAISNAKDFLLSILGDMEVVESENETIETIEKDWTLEGARYLYDVYSKCPKSQLENLKIVMTTTFRNPSGTAGRASLEGGIYLMAYNNNSIGLLDSINQFHKSVDEKGNTIYDKNDANYGLIRFKGVAAHEFGHIVDFAQNPRYSDTPEYRSITGWKQYNNIDTPDGADEVVKDLRSYMNTPDPEALAGNKDASDLVDLVARDLVMTDAGSESNIEASVYNVLDSKAPVEGFSADLSKEESLAEMEKRRDELWNQYCESGYADRDARDEHRALDNKINLFKPKLEGYQKADKYFADNQTNVDAFAEKLKDAPILKHIIRVTSKKDAWFNGEPFGGLKDRQIHSDYNKGTWYSYDTKARNKKISNYQFSTPYEEFAELFASYMAADEAKRKTPEPLKTWFENTVLKDNNHLKKSTTSVDS